MRPTIIFTLLLSLLTAAGPLASADTVPASYRQRAAVTVTTMKHLALVATPANDGSSLQALITELNLSRDRIILRNGLVALAGTELSSQGIDWLESELQAAAWDGAGALRILMEDPVLTNLVFRIHIQLYILKWTRLTKQEAQNEVSRIAAGYIARFERILAKLGSEENNLRAFEEREKIPFRFMSIQDIGPDLYPVRLNAAKCLRRLVDSKF